MPRAMDAAGWEVAGHGWRWIDDRAVPEDVERADIGRTAATIERLVGRRPVGWYTGRTSSATRHLVVEEGGFLDNPTTTRTICPSTWRQPAGRTSWCRTALRRTTSRS
ncbi:polysaccharide deacetylase family protein [Streptomyces sp. NPDC059567]|uniref:polysaccharide deacetylase family protein n=1 Tax=Streptomyces sp. NPDC059567 TaxID=3346867 RepID=UPI003684B81B